MPPVAKNIAVNKVLSLAMLSDRMLIQVVSKDFRLSLRIYPVGIWGIL